MAGQLDPKDLQRYSIVGRALARAVVDAPESVFRGYLHADAERGSMPLARSVVRELKHAGFRLKDPGKRPFRPDDGESPQARMALEDYVQMALDMASAGTRAILNSYDRRNQRKALDDLTEAICNSFRANKVVLEKARPPDWRG